MTCRSIAWEILNQVFTRSAWAEELLRIRLNQAGLSRPDERLCRELCFGTIKMRGLLDYGLRACMQHKRLPALKVLNLLRLGAYQLLLLSKIPAHAAVYETVALAKTNLTGAQARMVNAVLRAVQRLGLPALPDPRRDPAYYLSIRHSFPLYLAKRWIRRFGEHTAEVMMTAANEPSRLWARVKITHSSRDKTLKRLQEQGIGIEPGILPTAFCLTPGKKSPEEILGLLADGLYYQDQASQMVGWLADPQPGQVCLDMCSAPGGKATHMAELMQGRGRVLAHDIRARKLKLVEQNARRLNLTNVETITALPSFLRAERVLVDAPCSGLGTLRRHAELRWRVQERDHKHMAKTQLALLQQAAAHVSAGGHLVYSTCTTEPEENENVVRAFLDSRPDFEMQPGPGSRGFPAEAFWDGEGFFRTYPKFTDMDGMFAARLVKKT